MIKAAIFDLDGTLVDSEPNWHGAWRNVVARFGVSLSEEDFIPTMGMQPVEGAAVFLRGHDIGDHTYEGLAAEVIEWMVDEAPAPDLMPGALRAVQLAVDSGLKVAIATSSPLAVAEKSIAGVGLSGIVDVVCSSQFESYGKPHPAVFLRAADKLDVDGASCVVIEDAPNGVIAAKAARMRCIVVPMGDIANHPAIALSDRTLSSLTELTAEDFGER